MLKLINIVKTILINKNTKNIITSPFPRKDGMGRIALAMRRFIAHIIAIIQIDLDI